MFYSVARLFVPDDAKLIYKTLICGRLRGWLRGAWPKQKSIHELLDRTIREGPQYIRRGGGAVVVVVSKEYRDSLGRGKSVSDVDSESDPE